MYNATLYLNTGFNAVNIPDSAATLNRVSSANKVTVPALDIYQARELSSFIIKCTNYAQIRNADYLYLVNSQDSTDFAYYSIQNIRMVSMDTAVVSVTMDYILSCGGVSALDFTDGICERHHVSVDGFGMYDEPDPYMNPAETLKIEESNPEFASSASDKADVVFLESTVDLYKTYWHYDDSAEDLTGIDYKSDDNVVTVPSVYGVNNQSSELDYIAAFAGMPYPLPNAQNNYNLTLMPNVAVYVSNAHGTGILNTQGGGQANIDWLPEALSLVRSLGIESCILAQWCIPYYMVNQTELKTNYDPRGGTSGQLGLNTGIVETLKGSRVQVTLGTLPFIHTYSNTIHNNRLYYGGNTQYTIVSVASGNSASFLPEEIYDYSASQDLYPVIEMRVDPRPNGMPYFRFETYRGSKDPLLFFTNAVKGLQWQNTPLVYEGASGSLINQYAYNARRASADEAYNFEKDSEVLNIIRTNVRGVSNVAGDTISAVGYGVTSKWGEMAGSIANGVESLGNTIIDDVQHYKNWHHMQDSYNIEKNTELQALLISNRVVSPSMNFPISEGIRDYVGNGCLVYRTYYSDNDAARIDKILTMYGYRHTTPISNDLLTNRPKFNYIQAYGVEIKNTNIPKWMRDGIGAQFAAGTRIWHVLPDTSAYTDGSNDIQP